MLRYLRLALYYSLLIVLLALGLLLSADLYVSWQASDRTYHNLEDIPHQPAALLLGTSKYIGKRINLFYPPRVNAAYSLFDAGKVDAIILSGDNATRYYNEPQTMENDLRRKGVPVKYMEKDYAGFRTLDSVVRAREIFDQQRITIVSQQFHCERAIYIAEQVGVDAICFVAEDATGMGAVKIRLREVLARAKAILDIHILDKQPRFLGPKVPVTLRVKPEKPEEATKDEGADGKEDPAQSEG